MAASSNLLVRPRGFVAHGGAAKLVCGLLTATSLALVAGCGNDRSPTDATDTAVASPIAPDASETVTPSTHAPDVTTSTSAMTIELSTAGASSTAEPVGTTSPATDVAAWAPIDFEPPVWVLPYSGQPVGAASPEPPNDHTATLADGYYAVSYSHPWSPETPNVLRLTIERYVECTEVGPECPEVGANHDNGSFLRIDPEWSRATDIVLDDTVPVIVEGWRCPPNEDEREIKQGTGTQLLELADAYAAAFQRDVVPLLDANTDVFEAFVTLDETRSSSDFVAQSTLCEDAPWILPVRFVHGDAPMLIPPDGPRDDDAVDAGWLLSYDNLQGVRVLDGVIGLYFYLGFNS